MLPRTYRPECKAVNGAALLKLSCQSQNLIPLSFSPHKVTTGAEIKCPNIEKERESERENEVRGDGEKQIERSEGRDR